jgi:1-acyl-sn-glycerol-3-phosphate acyltransferase
MILFRSILYVIWLYGAMTLIGAALAPFILFDREYIHLALRTWARASVFGLRWIVGARVKFEGLDYAPKGAALIASKHQSMLDTLAPSLVLERTAYVFKRELLKQPVLGWYLDRGRMIPVDREAHASALKDLIRHARTAIAEQRQIIIFPEGTRQEPGAPPDYKPGVAALYRDLKLPCTPVALNTGLIWPANGIKRYPGEAVIRFLPPIPAGLSREDFMRELEARIESGSDALLPADTGPPAP